VKKVHCKHIVLKEQRALHEFCFIGISRQEVARGEILNGFRSSWDFQRNLNVRASLFSLASNLTDFMKKMDAKLPSTF